LASGLCGVTIIPGRHRSFLEWPIVEGSPMAMPFSVNCGGALLSKIEPISLKNGWRTLSPPAAVSG
jgi:hypothetical protein